MKITKWIAGAALAAALTACSSPHHTAAVPNLPGSGGVSAGGHSASQAATLHAAAQCIRTHGVPSYQDPVVTADGHVYTDTRSLYHQSSAELATIRRACVRQLTAAGFQLQDQPPAPPQLVQAGVRTARCLRAHGLPNYRDPTSSTPFTPGHGFDMTPDELTDNGALGKQDANAQQAFAACRHQQYAEIAASTLQSLAHD
jgi:hypothetical protein